jgi:glucuronate isomerase
MAAKGLFGVDDINENTYRELNKKVLASNYAGWYHFVLKEKAGIDVSILDPLEKLMKKDPVVQQEFFVQVKRFDYLFWLNKDIIKSIGKQKNIEITSLTGLLDHVESEIREAVEKKKIIGLKSGIAYVRSLYFEDVPREDAEKIYNKKFVSGLDISQEESKKLQDFLMHQLLEKAQRYHLPFQIHTGILTWNWRKVPIENTNATNLSNLFLKYPRLRFVIFHGSYPYMAELGTLAKNLPNVYIDMCWMYMISPEASRRYLEEWLLTVPSNKIMAFGGDIGPAVESVYSHAVLARKIITEVLTGMVKKEYITEQDACRIAERILRENALELYSLKKVSGHYERSE